MRAASAIVVLALALALAPALAQAHITSFPQAQPLVLGPYNALVEPKPDPMYANSALSMTAIFSRAADGTYAPDLPAKLRLQGPNGFNKSADLAPDGTGYSIASVVVPVTGNYTASIIVDDGNGTYQNHTTFFAYPDLPIRIQSEDPTQPDPSTNVSFTVSLQTVDNITLQPKDAITDLTVHMQHWSDDHKIVYSDDPYPMKRVGVGLWHLDYDFKTSGMFHLQFESVSGGFKQGDVPMLHVYARDPPGGTKASPGAALPLVALGIVAAAVATRRR